MLDACLNEGPQFVTQRGKEAAVLVSIAEWRRLQGAPARTLKDLLLSDEGRGELNVPPRGRSSITKSER
jgi:antitoxin Phd